MKACQRMPAGASRSQFEATNSKTNLAIRSKYLILKDLVPKKGLEPPHPCEYVDLNHARLPIPPLRHERLVWISQTGSIFESRKWGKTCQMARSALLPAVSGVSKLRVHQACEANRIPAAVRDCDRQVPCRRSGNARSSWFHCRHSECAAPSPRTGDRVH